MRLKPQPFREIKRRLEAVGFVEASQKGSHVDTAIVPNKREVPVGTLRSILSQAHIEPDDWESSAKKRSPAYWLTSRWPRSRAR